MSRTFSIRDADDFRIELSLSEEEIQRLDLGAIMGRISSEHPDQPSYERQRLIFRGRALREPRLKLSELFSDSSEMFRLYLVVSRERDVQGRVGSTPSPQPRETFDGNNGPNTHSGLASSETTSTISNSFGGNQEIFLRLDERSERAALEYIGSSPGRSPGSDVSTTELMSSLSQIRRRRGSSLGSNSDAWGETTTTTGSVAVTETAESGAANFEGQAEVARGPADPQPPPPVVNGGPAENAEEGGGGIDIAAALARLGIGGGPAAGGGEEGGEGGRQPVRWIDLSVLLRLTIGFMLLNQGSRGSECYFFLGCAAIYYVFETGIAKELLTRYFLGPVAPAGVAGAEAAGRGLANNNNNNNNNNAEPPAEGPGGGAADITGSDNNVRPPVNRWYSLYLEGFPVPQQPGWLLDALSVVMAFCASLKPGWDPRPVNPHFFRDIFNVGAAGAGAGADANVNAG